MFRGGIQPGLNSDPLANKKLEFLTLAKNNTNVDEFSKALKELTFEELRKLKFDLPFRDQLPRPYDRIVEFAFDEKRNEVEASRFKKLKEEAVSKAAWKGGVAGAFVGALGGGATATAFFTKLTFNSAVGVIALFSMLGGGAGAYTAGEEAEKQLNKETLMAIPKPQ